MSDHDLDVRYPSAPLSDTVLRVKALESLLTEKELVDPAALDELIHTYETKVGPRNGAKVVGRSVLTANQVLFWHALRLTGVRPPVVGYGQVFARGLPS